MTSLLGGPKNNHSHTKMVLKAVTVEYGRVVINQGWIQGVGLRGSNTQENVVWLE